MHWEIVPGPSVSHVPDLRIDSEAATLSMREGLAAARVVDDPMDRLVQLRERDAHSDRLRQVPADRQLRVVDPHEVFRGRAHEKV